MSENFLLTFDQSVVQNNQPDNELLTILRDSGELEDHKSLFLKIIEQWEDSGEPNLSEKNLREFKGSLHSVKGIVATIGLYTAQKIAHRAESILEYIERSNIPFEKVHKIITAEIEKIFFVVDNPSENYPVSVAQNLNSLLPTENAAEEKNLIVLPIAPIVEQKKEDLPVKQSIRVDSLLIENVINTLSEIRLGRYGSALINENKRNMLFEINESNEKLVNLVRELELRADTQMQSSSSGNNSSFDALEMDRYTRLQELVRFLSETVNDIVKGVVLVEGMMSQQRAIIDSQSALAEEVIDSMLGTRVVNLGLISDRFYKTVKKTSEELNKKVNLETEGDSISIDKVILDKVIDPIGHLLRNCVSHGIETPDERIAIGKSAFGTIKIKVNSFGNRLIISISDDGAGLNLNKIRERAIEKGMISEDIKVTDPIIKDLIFESGFSTATSVTEIAGRGVGMDVVKKAVLALSGFIQIETREGHGTEFILNLPVGVATTQAVILKRKDKIYAIPSLLVSTIQSVSRVNLENAIDNEKITLLDKVYDFAYIGSLLGEKRDLKGLVKSSNQVILLESYGQQMALWVDKIEGVNEIIVKSLGTYFDSIKGILGSTLLGDGSQGLVINPLELKIFNFSNSSKESKSEKLNIENNLVLIVDDSFTMRSSLNKLLTKHGYETVLAKNGEEGLQKIKEQSPKYILSDIEMPVMDGFTFVQNIRKMPHLSSVPIIMISSRSVDKYINLAKEHGANDFIGKPVKEDELIEKLKAFQPV